MKPEIVKYVQILTRDEFCMFILCVYIMKVHSILRYRCGGQLVPRKLTELLN